VAGDIPVRPGPRGILKKTASTRKWILLAERCGRRDFGATANPSPTIYSKRQILAWRPPIGQSPIWSVGKLPANSTFLSGRINVGPTYPQPEATVSSDESASDRRLIRGPRRNATGRPLTQIHLSKFGNFVLSRSTVERHFGATGLQTVF